ncbi:Hypothetical predicted protein [Paramuricea clavata]|uniref:Reverse transcriptase domain-containing protein n=1 Tax=Paramuricea clavata TaxID=317549 RepID=A0A6S7IZ12_PARCT|nr:Hypothetical predicted protein [Paramuricea clavata]
MERLPRGINSILLGTVYHPPQSDDHVLRMHIFKCLDSLLATYPNSAILVLGDFNQFKPGNLCNSFRLKKLVTKPTRESNIIDQAFSTLSPYYDAIILPPIGQSDHSSILLQLILTHAPSLPTTRLQKRDYRAPNKQNLISRLNTVNWTPLMRLNSCEEQLDSFQSVVHVALNSCIPMRRQQRVKLKTCKSDWKEIKAGVPQGTKLGPLFFLIMVNDLSSELPLYKYVDDCAISEVVRVCEPDLPKLQQELDNVTQWSSANNMKLNVKKTKDFTVSFLINQPLAQPLIVNNQPLEAVNTIKLLGVNLTSDLKWTTHIRHISSKASKRLYALRILRRNGVQPSDLRANSPVLQSGIAVKHIAKCCPSKFKCRIEGCGASHHTLLHIPNQQKKESNQDSSQKDGSDLQAGSVNTAFLQYSDAVLLQVVPLRVFGKRGKVVTVSAMLDSGSEITLVDPSLASTLDLYGQPDELVVSTVSNDIDIQHGYRVNLSVESLIDN